MSSHYLNQFWTVVHWSLGNKYQWNLIQRKTILIQEIEFENVVYKVAIFSRPQCVNCFLFLFFGWLFFFWGGGCSCCFFHPPHTTPHPMLVLSFVLRRWQFLVSPATKFKIKPLVLKPEYSGVTMSIPWLLKPWLVRHQVIKKTVSIIAAEWRIYASVNQPSLVQIMAWRLTGAKPLSESVLEYC